LHEANRSVHQQLPKVQSRPDASRRSDTLVSGTAQRLTPWWLPARRLSIQGSRSSLSEEVPPINPRADVVATALSIRPSRRSSGDRLLMIITNQTVHPPTTANQTGVSLSKSPDFSPSLTNCTSVPEIDALSNLFLRRKRGILSRLAR